MADRLMIERLRFHRGTPSASETTMPGPWSGRIDIAAPRRPECSARRASPILSWSSGAPVRRDGAGSAISALCSTIPSPSWSPTVLSYGGGLRTDVSRLLTFLFLRCRNMVDRNPGVGKPPLDPLEQLEGIPRPLLRRHLTEPVSNGSRRPPAGRAIARAAGSSANGAPLWCRAEPSRPSWLVFPEQGAHRVRLG